MRNLLRKPLPWMVLAECAVVAALVLVAWHLIVDAPARVVPLTPSASPRANARDGFGPVSTYVTGQAKPPTHSVFPGLNVDPGFWRLRLADLNRAQTAFERLQWNLVHALMDAAHRYMNSVVLPSIAHAERRAA
ncbi:MAG: hypothetical protein M3082_07845 [Candidatus Dormibacteraeota bacterium]|nr:hypothetical protein [Candidatus Dormibacteraeota bacterium]